eukprot:259697-Rhodomonas_salina.1
MVPVSRSSRHIADFTWPQYHTLLLFPCSSAITIYQYRTSRSKCVGRYGDATSSRTNAGRSPEAA